MKQKLIKVKTNESFNYNINKVFLGIFTILFGLIFLIDNLNIYPLNINLANLGPLFIIFIGLSFFNKKSAISVTIGSVITIICVALFSFSLSLYTTNSAELVYRSNVTPIVVTKDMNMERADIELNVAAGEVNIYGIDSENLIEGKLIASKVNSDIDQIINGPVQKVNISLSGKKGLMMVGKEFKNKLNIGIDKNVPLNFIFNAGGSSNEVDLSEMKAEKIVIAAGASDISLKLGDKVNSNVVIEAGASSVNLELPEDMGVRMVVESGFSSQELPGFSLVNDNTYQSLNYETKEKKIDIEITTVMANLKVNWYSPIRQKEISLFYYNQIEDKKSACDVKYILPIKRYVTESNNQIKDAIELLIAGKLTEEEIKAGFSTEFPNEKFKLLNSNLVDGVLTLEFSEVPGFTTGGICRVKLLGSEIIRTAKQFPGVEKVVFEPETLFEP